MCNQYLASLPVALHLNKAVLFYLSPFHGHIVNPVLVEMEIGESWQKSEDTYEDISLCILYHILAAVT
jgi:hypothetical protein